jgi:hypothetical protein
MVMGPPRIGLLLVSLLLCGCQAESRLPDTCTPGASSSSCLGGQWRNVEPAYPRMFANVACSDQGLFVWGGVAGPITGGPCAYGCQGGSVFDFAGETWNELPLEGAPPSHDFGSAVWTGTEWLVWGGEFFGPAESGGRYDPISARWSNMSATGQPIARKDFAYAWTGSELLVWGGSANPFIGQNELALGDGGAYDPVKDTWRPLNSSNALASNARPLSVWTGKRWLVSRAIGQNGSYSVEGAAYDPIDDSWHPALLGRAPDRPLWLRAVWTEKKAFFFGFVGDPNAGDISGSAGIYDPDSDSWAPVPRLGGPDPNSAPALVWTGMHVIALGSREVDEGGGRYLDVPHGRAFSVKENKWVAMPSGFRARWRPTACWSNGKLYLWGGSIGDGDQVDGTVDIWTPPGDSDSGMR